MQEALRHHGALPRSPQPTDARRKPWFRATIEGTTSHAAPCGAMSFAARKHGPPLPLAGFRGSPGRITHLDRTTAKALPRTGSRGQRPSTNSGPTLRSRVESGNLFGQAAPLPEVPAGPAIPVLGVFEIALLDVHDSVQPRRCVGINLLHQIVRLGPVADLQLRDHLAQQVGLRSVVHHVISPLLTSRFSPQLMLRPERLMARPKFGLAAQDFEAGGEAWIPEQSRSPAMPSCRCQSCRDGFR